MTHFPEEERNNATALSLGQTLQASGENQIAIFWYSKAARLPVSQTLQVQAQLAQLKLLINQENCSAAIALLPIIEQNLNEIPLSHQQIYTQITFAERLTELPKQSNDQTSLLSWKSIATRLVKTQKMAQLLGDKRAEVYAIGNLGKIYGRTQQWAIAQKLTEQALQISQELNTSELTYFWEWQLGRIFAQ